MRSLLITLCLFTASAHAVPAQFTHQGRLLDVDGVPLEGEAVITFRVTSADEGGESLWEETLTVLLTSGFYSAVLGADEDDNPLDTDVLSQAPVWLEIQLDGEEPMAPRSAVHSVPYATMAAVAEELSGGPVDASEVAVSGALVIDSDGQWVGPVPPVDWADLTGVPEGIADGSDTDTLLSLGVSCLDGDVARWDASLGEWICSEDRDTVLTADEVRSHVGEAPIDLASGSTVGGAALLTGADTLAPGWSDLTGVPDGFADGEDADTLAARACEDGQILVYSMVGGSWMCGTDTDETLSSAEVQTMVEAMTGLALSAGTTIGGETPRMSGETVPWADISGVPDAVTTDSDSLAALDCEDGQLVVIEDGVWSCTSLVDRFDADADGVMAWADCDDSDPTLLSVEADGDCDGTLRAEDCDDGDATSTVVADDEDCDGYLTEDDCDDTDDTIHPGADEVCDGLDNDCDDAVDNGVVGLGEVCPAESCAAILEADSSSEDGEYYVDFDGDTRSVQCDMSTDGGGWTLLYETDFEDGDTTGWSFSTTSVCGEWTRILGGYDVISGGEFERDVHTSGISHSQVRLEMNYLFIDSWDDELGYVKIDGAEVWSRVHHFDDTDTRVCGVGYYDAREAINVTRSHTGAIVQLKVGSHLGDVPVDESFGADDIEVWIR